MFTTSHLHPMLVHFPIALVAVGFIADFVYVVIRKENCFSKMGFYLLFAGTIAAVATFLSGMLFTSEMAGAAGAVRETHEVFAWVTVILLLITSILRIYTLARKTESNQTRWLILILYFLTAVSVSITGFYGGTLVYNYMMPL
jgi:uncharacterized membrane protein